MSEDYRKILVDSIKAEGNLTADKLRALSDEHLLAIHRASSWACNECHWTSKECGDFYKARKALGLLCDKDYLNK